MKAGKIAKEDVLRWRERTPAALAMTKFTSWVQKHVLFKVAEKLIIDGDTLDLDNDEDERSRFLHGLARAVGGADFFYDADERNAWAGLHFLEELRHSPHVTHNPLFPVSGHCIVHGVWAGNVPHGDGMAWFPVGRDPHEIIFARQKASFKDADREWPLYDEIQGVFDHGRLRTDVKTHIRFRTGDRYVGFFVPFGGKARADHRGTWYGQSCLELALSPFSRLSKRPPPPHPTHPTPPPSLSPVSADAVGNERAHLFISERSHSLKTAAAVTP